MSECFVETVGIEEGHQSGDHGESKKPDEHERVDHQVEDDGEHDQ
ncbi:MAG: hypothetical protein ACJA14_002894, partial [Ilumatobacter sp.]